MPEVNKLTMSQLVQLIKLHGGGGGGGGGLDCATCDGDDLTVDGDLTVAGKDIVIKYDANNYVTLTVDSDGNLEVTPTSNIGTPKIKLKAPIIDENDDIVEGPTGVNSVIGWEVMS